MLKTRPAQTVKEWLASVPADRKKAIDAVRATVNKHLPKGYVETVDWGMLGWVVPLERFPDTHNGHALMLAALGAHTKRMTLYLMTIYGDPTVRNEFETAYKKTGKKWDVGGCCVHFKTLDDLPLDVVGKAIARVGVDKYIESYVSSRPKKGQSRKPQKASVKKAKKR